MLERPGDYIVVRDSQSCTAVGDTVEMGGGESYELRPTYLTGTVPAECEGPAAMIFRMARTERTSPGLSQEQTSGPKRHLTDVQPVSFIQ